MKGLVQHTPTDEDISNLLKEFTVDFLLKGYGHLVEELHTQLLSNLVGSFGVDNVLVVVVVVGIDCNKIVCELYRKYPSIRRISFGWSPIS